MTEFSIRIDRLSERLRRGTNQCDLIEQRACLTEQRLTTLNQSVQNLARLIEISLLILISSDKDKSLWLELISDENKQITNTIRQHFFYRLESFLHRSMIDDEEKCAYMNALVLVHKPSIVSSNVFF